MELSPVLMESKGLKKSQVPLKQGQDLTLPGGISYVSLLFSVFTLGIASILLKTPALPGGFL